MRYLIFGTGGVGGSVGGYLSAAGNDVTFIARGDKLEALSENGLLFHSANKGDIMLKPINVISPENITDDYDVIFFCTKGFSALSAARTLKRKNCKKAVVIPLLNGYGWSEKISEILKDINVLDGCIYIRSYSSAPTEVIQYGSQNKLIFGKTENSNVDDNLLLSIKSDLENSGIDAIISHDIKKEVFRKFAFESPVAAALSYFDSTAAAIQKKGKKRDCLIHLFNEIKAIGESIGITYENDIVSENIHLSDTLKSDMTTPLQRDMALGGMTEIDNMIFEVYRMSQKYKVKTPEYTKIASYFGYFKND